MNNPGIYSLTQLDGSSDLAITTAGTQTCDVIDSLHGMSAVSLQARLAYGSGGTKVSVYIQTSLDGGNSWVDIACLTFTTASATKVINLSGLTPVTTAATPTDGALVDDTAVDGILGDRLRAKVVSAGTYAGSTVVSVRASVR
jgi:hypothetical protein